MNIFIKRVSLASFLFLIVVILFSFFHTSSVFAYSCTSYLQPNQCTTSPDAGVSQGTNYIVDKCNVNGSTQYFCFNPNKDLYYTQPNSCTTTPYGPTGNVPGHLYLVKKVGTNTFYCVTDCTAYPGFPGCPAATTPTPPTGPGTSTTLSLVLALPGIGIQTGAIGSSNPSHLVRSVKVELYDATVTNPGGAGTTPLGSGTGIVVYDSQGNNAGYFDSITSPAKPINITFKGTLPTNNEYKVLIEMPQYLYQLAIPLTQADQNIPNAFVITQGANVVTSPTTLNPGAITQPNSMSILADYNQILTCFKNSTDPTCIKTSDGIPFTDLDDNGVVNLVDLNIWIRSLGGMEQLQPSPCSNGVCQGD